MPTTACGSCPRRLGREGGAAENKTTSDRESKKVLFSWKFQDFLDVHDGFFFCSNSWGFVQTRG